MFRFDERVVEKNGKSRWINWKKKTEKKFRNREIYKSREKIRRGDDILELNSLKKLLNFDSVYKIQRDLTRFKRV